MKPLSHSERKSLIPHLHRTAAAIEQILEAGLTTASDATHQSFAVTFQEAARLKLLRLGSTLRNTQEEIARFVKDDPRFSQPRLMFFLNRSWLLCKGIEQSLDDGDDARLEQLFGTPAAKKIDTLRVVCLGVIKKIAAGTFCSFEFRLRSLDDGEYWTWSTVFPLRPGLEIPPEGFLHIPQKQKFSANLFLERQPIEITSAMAGETPLGHRKLQLTNESTVSAVEGSIDWTRNLHWKPAGARQRITQHEISPFEVDVELQEEVMFDDYMLRSAELRESDNQHVFPLNYLGTEFDVVVADSVEGESAKAALEAQVEKDDPPPLYGVLHYAKARLVVQPLTLFDDGQPNYITISEKAVDRKALLSVLNFR
ncbi:hypothetical protein Pan258_29970 [Symmachiella dynata]|uniref:hypothetical protein n=1 Tax=Symmachiella dynata TaxID=2527995 RepID=UPI0011896C79|nr:hypothetical protein [Symmachiella dynata]QDT48950.1 hypothetical protein Pan258_29970 [Symmachiella dynata]